MVVAGHGAYFAAIKATYDSLRAQRQLTHSTSNLSATELTHTYTLPGELRGVGQRVHGCQRVAEAQGKR